MAFVLQRLNSVFKSLILAVWRRRTVILFCISAASFIMNLAILSISFRVHALVACQFFCRAVVPQFWKIISRFLDPPYLYILLNFVLMRIVVKSGVLSPAKHVDLPQDAEPITSTKASLAESCDVERSDAPLPSSPKNHEQEVEKKHQIGLFAEPLHNDGSDAHLYSSPRKNDFTQCDIEIQDAFSESTATTSSQVQLPLSNSVEAAEGIIFYTAYEQKEGSASHRILMEDPVFKVEAQVVQIQESSNVGGSPDDQLLHIDVDEREDMTAEDVNRKADDFITNFRKQLKLQRQDSYNRYLCLLGGEGRSR